jgi:hypothetical protein
MAQHLLDQRGLADLSRPGHDLQETARLDEPVGENFGLDPLEGGLRRITQYAE